VSTIFKVIPEITKQRVSLYDEVVVFKLQPRESSPPAQNLPEPVGPSPGWK
jgi:hypothetical protein